MDGVRPVVRVLEIEFEVVGERKFRIVVLPQVLRKPKLLLKESRGDLYQRLANQRQATPLSGPNNCNLDLVGKFLSEVESRKIGKNAVSKDCDLHSLSS